MAPSARPSKNGFCTDEDEYYGINKGDRKTRKPLVEKKRRARINESLQELRTLLADTDLQSKMENAEVLELTVKRVERILKNRTQETDALNREASERFAAGYIQCMHEVHMFVSNCPGIDATVAAELLNHLLECMPLNEDHFQDMFMDLITDTSSNHGNSTWPIGDALCGALLGSPGGRSSTSSGGSPSPSALSPSPSFTSSSSALSPSPSFTSSSSALSPAPSSASSDDLCSDLDETDSEHNHGSAENQEAQILPTITYSKSMWRPW